MEPRKKRSRRLPGLLMGILWILAGCVAPDGSIIRYQKAPDGSVIGWQVEAPVITATEAMVEATVEASEEATEAPTTEAVAEASTMTPAESIDEAPATTPAGEIRDDTLIALPYAYTNPQYPWSIGYPVGWSVDDTDPAYVTINLILRDKLFAQCGIHGSFLGFDTLFSFVNDTLKFHEEYLADHGLDIVTSKKKTITLPGGMHGFEVIEEIAPSDKIRQLYFFANGEGYLIDCEAGDEYWPLLGPFMDEIINSFALETD